MIRRRVSLLFLIAAAIAAAGRALTGAVRPAKPATEAR